MENENEIMLQPPDGDFDIHPLEQTEDNLPKNKPDVPEPDEVLFEVDENLNVTSKIKSDIDLENEEEPEEKPEEKPVPKAPKSVKEPVSEDKEFYSALGESLKEWGVLEGFESEEFDGTLESFKNILTADKETFAKQYMEEKLGSLTPKQREILNLAENSVRDDEIVEITSRLQDLKGITSEDLATNKDLAKSVYAYRLQQAGFSKSKIDKYVSIAEDANSLVDEAEESLTELIAADEANLERAKGTAKQREAAIAKQRLERAESLKNSVFETKEFIPGVSVNDKLKQAVYDSMTKTVGEGPNGPVNAIGKISFSNPDGFQALLHYYSVIGLFNQDKKGNFIPDISKIKTAGKTQIIQELDKTSTLKRGLFRGGNLDSVAPEDGETLLDRLRRDKRN